VKTGGVSRNLLKIYAGTPSAITALLSTSLTSNANGSGYGNNQGDNNNQGYVRRGYQTGQ
jgi:hypothetical protein